MARTRTLLQMRTSVRQRADMANTTFVTDAEINEYINQGIAEFWDELYQKRGDLLYSTTTFTTASGTESYALPATCFEVLKATIEVQNATQDLQHYELSQREVFQPYASFRGVPIVFRAVGGNVSLLPIANGAYSGTIYYVTTAPSLTSDNDTFDGIDGWEDFAIWKAVFECLAKEGTDTTAAEKRMAAAMRRVSMLGGHLNARQSPKKADVYQNRRYLDRPWYRLPRP